MARKTSILPVKMSFESAGLRLAIADINPLRPVTAAVKRTQKYTQIATSIQEVRIIEPPVVAHDHSNRGKYLLLDGHLRLEVLKEMGATEVICIISTDDEAYTYNKRVSRLAIVQEHKMILKAIERGVSEERIAKTLNLKDKHVAAGTFWIFKKMVPFRQIEAAELMVAMNKYTISYGRSLLAATPQGQLVETGKPKAIKGLTDEQISLMERESGNLEREFKIAEQSYGTDHLDLLLAKGYLGNLLGNPRVVRYLVQNHREILVEFQKIAELETAAA